MTTLPTWAYWLTAVGAPVVGAIGVLYGHLVTRRGLEQADRWRRREETMRMLRWSAEQAGSTDDRVSDIGLAALTGLVDSELLQQEDVEFIESVAEAAVEGLPQVIQEYGVNGDVVLEVESQPREE